MESTTYGLFRELDGLHESGRSVVRRQDDVHRNEDGSRRDTAGRKLQLGRVRVRSGKRCGSLSKIDPRSIHVDQRKRDTRRDAWNRDYAPNWTRTEPSSDEKRLENAKPVFLFAFFYVCILIMIGSD